jgi:hypothetical protein
MNVNIFNSLQWNETGALSRSLTGVIIGKSWPGTYPFFQVRTSRFGDVY